MKNDLKYWLAINQFNKIGPNRFKKLYNYFPSMKEAWQASVLELQKAGLEEKIVQELIIKKNQINPDQELEKVQKEKINVITIKNIQYPKLLKEIFYPPALLYIKGNIDILNTNLNLAVVGTRKISVYGQQITPQLITPLVKNGFTITSGLALGIDALAHQTTLEAKGKTIAVLGSGLDKQNIYPSSNRYLANNIIENQGAVISEFPIGMQPLKQNFPTRNRIIAGLTLGTLVLEAGQRSGSLITAYSALENNREVFAVPGPLSSPTSIGTHKLIQQGAKLVTSHLDILQELKFENYITENNQPKQIPDNKEQQIILNFLNSQPSHIDHLIKQTNLPPNIINSQLSLMEMKGLIKNIGNQNYIIIN